MALLHAHLTSLPDDLLARILAFTAPRDVEAMAVASKTVARHVLPRFPLWKTMFCNRWAMLNFSLDDTIDVEIDARLRALFPSESRMYQLLAHAVTPVPAYADIPATMQYGQGINNTIVALNSDLSVRAVKSRRGREARTSDIAFAGQLLGGDRSVRANTTFPTTFHVQVYKRRVPHTDSKFKYEIGVTASGYFEITIAQREQEQPSRRHLRIGGSDMSSIGVGTPRFRLMDKQPGWDRQSFGYHGDDGRFYHNTGYGQHFGPSFDIGDTVGCGVWRDTQTSHSSVFFTNNGDLIPTGDRDIDYELFGECEGMAGLLANQLQWYTISDFDGESSDSEDDDDMDESSADDEVEYMDADDVQFVVRRIGALYGDDPDFGDMEDVDDSDYIESELEFEDDGGDNE
uniref:F-box domain-containing protein n=1 Tax=Globisporangium ultimum (strain ATCC 200006 / CBS 805.95 / DAOM BR144) TaxID=431595 RepID=K3W6V9_GLOUD